MLALMRQLWVLWDCIMIGNNLVSYLLLDMCTSVTYLLGHLAFKFGHLALQM